MFGRKSDSRPDRNQAATLPKAATLPDTAPILDEETTSSISCGMTIVGKLFCGGLLKLFGRVEGELQGSSVLICEGARVEGTVVAKELTIAGHVEGTIRAVRVKLLNTGVVQGEIFYESLAIDE